MEREQFEKIIQEINDGKIEALHKVEEECDSFYNAKPQIVEKGLNIDKHRWYEISTIVYKIGDWFLGVRGVSQLYSESSSWSDIGVKTEAFEMEEVYRVTYQKKSN